MDVSRIDRGIVTVRWNAKTMEVQTQRIRRHLYFWALLSAMEENSRNVSSTKASVWRLVSGYAAALVRGSSVMVGTVRSGDHWVQSRNERKYPGLLSAAEQIAALTN